MDMIISTNLVHVFFGPAIPTYFILLFHNFSVSCNKYCNLIGQEEISI